MRIAAVALASLLAASAASAAAQERIPALDPQPADRELLGYAVIPSLSQLLAHSEAAGRHFAPLAEGQLAMQAGGMLGDPGLANLDPARPIIIMLVAGPEAPSAPEISAWIPAQDPAKYVATAGIYHAAGAVSGTLAVIAQTAAAVERAQRHAAVYEALAAPVKADLRLRLCADRILALYRDPLTAAIDGWAGTLSAMPRGAGQLDPGPLMRMELGLLLQVARDLRDLQLDLGVDGDAVTMTSTLAAMPDSPLAKALVAPAIAGRRAGEMIGPGEGALVMAGACDGRAVCTYAAALLRALKGQPGAAAVDEHILALVDAAAETFTGDMAARMTLDAKGGVGMTNAYGVSSSERARALMRESAALMTGDGAIARLYASLGLPVTMTYKNDARRLGDTTVDRMSMDLDLKQLPREQVAAMSAMLRPWEIAFAPRWLIMAQDPAALDAATERAHSAKPAGALATAAEKALGAGRDLYVDYDLLAVMRLSFAGLANGPAAAAMKPMLDALTALPPEPPLVGAGTLERGLLRTEVRLPLQPFADLTKAMQQARGQAAPQPPGKVAQPGGEGQF